MHVQTDLRRWMRLVEATTPVHSLSRASQIDIAENLIDLIPALRDDSPDEVVGFFDFVDMPPVRLGTANPRALYAQFANRGTSEKVVAQYTQMLQHGVRFDPVIVSGKEFIDGGHRVAAYIAANKARIPVVDIAALLAYDWDDALNG
jgi:hypothetical protein